jgi:hypothetical protein
MLVSSTDPALYLLHPREVADESLPGRVRIYEGQMREVVEWARSYLGHPHAALGREGPVCPYTEPSLQRSLFWLTVFPGRAPAQEDMSTVVRKYRDWFSELEPVSGKDAESKAIVILFADLDPAYLWLIDAVQASLKPQFIREGLMLGQFHERCDEPALWNPSFRPLRCSVPLLAIRTMVRTDAPFLTKDAGSLRSYLQRFGHDVPGRLRDTVRDAARRFGLEDPDW